MSKGEDTRARVLEHAFNIASETGLESLTIGTLAERAGLSKSGLYAHFSSRDDLQIQVLDAGAELFSQLVMAPAIAQPRGLPRLLVIQELWLRWEMGALPGGCPFVSAAAEFDDREGSVRDRVVHHLERMYAALERAASIAVEEGHFRADLDVAAYAFEFWSIILSYQQFARLLRRPESERLALQSFEALNARSAA